MQENNLETPQPKKRGRKPSPTSSNIYFGPKEEDAVRCYLATESIDQKNVLFRDTIDPALRRLVKGVLRMPKFQKVIGIPIEQLEEDAYFQVLISLEKFNPNRIGKSGQTAKAYSYFGTVVKNFALGEKIKLDRNIKEHGTRVDASTIASQASDSEYTVEGFEDLRFQIIDGLDKLLTRSRANKNDLIVGTSLKYMLSNWHSLEFQTKNEFLRLLCQYCQLKPTIVARSLKKFKTVIYSDFLVTEDKRKNKPGNKVFKKKITEKRFDQE